MPGEQMHRAQDFRRQFLPMLRKWSQEPAPLPAVFTKRRLLHRQDRAPASPPCHRRADAPAAPASESTPIRSCARAGKRRTASRPPWDARLIRNRAGNPGSVKGSVRAPPPGCASASKTSTCRPAWARTIAAARPLGPAPMTAARRPRWCWICVVAALKPLPFACAVLCLLRCASRATSSLFPARRGAARSGYVPRD